MPDLLVFDLSGGAYDNETILRRPLGGTQSGVLETCLSLACDLDLALCNGVTEERRAGRLRFLPSRRVPVAEFVGADWVAFVNAVRPEVLEALPFRAGRPRLALWAQHDIDQPAVAPLARPSVLRQISRFLFLSEWQRTRYCEHFGIDRSLTAVIGNPYCPRAYERIGEPAKTYDQPRFIYTSTPFRGLDVLAAALPYVAARLPGATLTVLSGFELYGATGNDQYQPLFDRLAAMPNVEFMKPCGKLELYARLAQANVFSYPSTFAETFCVSALEARVMGNALFLTPTGALPEIFPDADFVAWPQPAPAVADWADFMVAAWRHVEARAGNGEFAAAAAAYCQRFSPAEVAARVRRALFD